MLITMKNTVNDRVVSLFKTLNLDEQDVASRISKHPTTITRILRGEHEPTKSTIKLIADATNANFEYLMYGKGEMLLQNKTIANVENPWKEEAYSRLNSDLEYWQKKYDQLFEAFISGKGLGKLWALRNAERPLRKVA